MLAIVCHSQCRWYRLIIELFVQIILPFIYETNVNITEVTIECINKSSNRNLSYLQSVLIATSVPVHLSLITSNSVYIYASKWVIGIYLIASINQWFMIKINWILRYFRMIIWMRRMMTPISYWVQLLSTINANEWINFST